MIRMLIGRILPVILFVALGIFLDARGWHGWGTAAYVLALQMFLLALVPWRRVTRRMSADMKAARAELQSAMRELAQKR